MVQHETKVRVRYGETDKMGYLYYGMYAQYFEVGRAELMRAIGMTYKALEDDYNIMMPVKSMQMRFVRPAKYDDLVTIKTAIKSFKPTSIVFHTELFNEQGKIMNGGDIRLSFVDGNTMKGCEAPQDLQDILAPYLSGEKKL